MPRPQLHRQAATTNPLLSAPRMEPSRHNIVSPIRDTGQYVIVNLLSGHADIINEAEWQVLQGNRKDFPDSFVEKGYVIDPVKEQQRFQMAYIDFLERRDQEEVQVFFVPTYQCNFDCSYCYQAPYLSAPERLTREVTDSFFRYLDKHVGARKHYITLFGGEPLLTGKAYHESIAYFLKEVKLRKLDLAVVTNGYHIPEYMDLLADVNIREIQVTLDGTREVHDRRRRQKQGGRSFQRIVAAIDNVLEAGMPVNLRMVVDKENIDDLPGLARFAIDKGWTDSPLFKTQLGRNYELHHCHDGKTKLYSRLSLYEDLYQLLQQHPEILAFHRPAFSITRFLKDNGRLPDPLFDACPACKGEWAFDYQGNIYSCTATVGKPGEELGTFHPEISHHDERIKTWQERDVRAIEACRNCNLQLACGGGCGAVSLNNEGNILAPDCRPVKELVVLGVSHYFAQNTPR